MSFPFLELYLLANNKTILIGPIRPIYIRMITTTLPITVKFGVNPALNPTVANAEKTSNIRFIWLTDDKKS